MSTASIPTSRRRFVFLAVVTCRADDDHRQQLQTDSSGVRPNEHEDKTFYASRKHVGNYLTVVFQLHELFRDERVRRTSAHRLSSRWVPDRSRSPVSVAITPVSQFVDRPARAPSRRTYLPATHPHRRAFFIRSYRSLSRYHRRVHVPPRRRIPFVTTAEKMSSPPTVCCASVARIGDGNVAAGASQLDSGHPYRSGVGRKVVVRVY